MSEARIPFAVVDGGADGAALAHRDDEALMLLAAGEYRGAFEVLVGRYLPRLTNYCGKFLGAARTGEEVAQEVLVDAWAHRHRYRPTARFEVFLFTLARNRCLNQVRDVARRGRWDAGLVADGPSPPAAALAPDQLDLLLAEERHRIVRSALLALAPKLRECVLLRYDQELDYAEIARIVRRPESTVRSRVFLGLKRLRAELAEEGEP